jgi:hypothetical protein
VSGVPGCSRLERLLGPVRAAEVLDRLAGELVATDHLPRDRASRLVCARACSGDPLLLAAAGQIWVLREDVDIDDAPALRLAVHARLAAPPRVIVADADATGVDAELDELLLEVLELYCLESWELDPLAVKPGALG